MKKLMSLADEMHGDIDMKYRDTFIIRTLDGVDDVVHFHHTDGAYGVCRDHDGNTMEVPLTQLHQPALPEGYYNTGKTSGWMHVRRTAQRTVKKGVCNMTVYATNHMGRQLSMRSVAASMSNVAYTANPRSGVARAINRLFAVKNDGTLLFNGDEVLPDTPAATLFEYMGENHEG